MLNETILESYITTQGFELEEVSSEQMEKFKNELIELGIKEEDFDKELENGEVFVCSICGEFIVGEYSHNAWPVNEGRCCQGCNDTEVIPARLQDLKK